MKLTLAYIKKFIKDDPRFDQVIDTDEPCKAFVWVNEGWTWDYMDGNRHMEAFVIDDEDGDDIDTVGYFKQQVKGITKEKDQVMGPKGYWEYVDKA